MTEADPRILVARLEDPNAIFRVQGEILAYGRTAIPALRAFLLGALAGDDAAEALVQVLWHHDLQSLSPAVRLAEKTVRNAAARALGRMGAREAIPALLAALGEQRLIGAGAALASMGDVRAIAGLVTLLEEPSHDEAAEVLASFGAAAVPALCAALDSVGRDGRESPGSEQRRTLAAEVLGRIGGAETEAALRRHVDDQSARVAVAAAVSLGRLGSDEPVVLDTLARALAEDNFVVQDDAVDVLVAAGVAAAPALAALLEDDRIPGRARRLAAWLLGKISDPNTAPALKRLAVQSEDPQLRSAILQAVATFRGDPEVDDLLHAARRDPARAVRDTARRLLRRP